MRSGLSRGCLHGSGDYTKNHRASLETDFDTVVNGIQGTPERNTGHNFQLRCSSPLFRCGFINKPGFNTIEFNEFGKAGRESLRVEEYP